MHETSDDPAATGSVVPRKFLESPEQSGPFFFVAAQGRSGSRQCTKLPTIRPRQAPLCRASFWRVPSNRGRFSLWRELIASARRRQDRRRSGLREYSSWLNVR
jgi:hypothetical protein